MCFAYLGKINIQPLSVWATKRLFIAYVAINSIELKIFSHTVLRIVSRWVYSVPEDTDPIAGSGMVKTCYSSLWDQTHGFTSQGNQDVVQVFGSCPHVELCSWELIQCC